MVKLDMKVRIFHALKYSNAYNIEDKSVKRNREILKLRHLQHNIEHTILIKLKK